jgi:hypothetical protein
MFLKQLGKKKMEHVSSDSGQGPGKSSYEYLLFLQQVDKKDVNKTRMTQGRVEWNAGRTHVTQDRGQWPDPGNTYISHLATQKTVNFLTS